MQKDQKNVRSHGELNPALPIQSQVSLPSNHQLMKIASKNGKIKKNVGSYGELNPALPIQSQVVIPPNHQLMKIVNQVIWF